jgi:predicted TIM-barrel fold metal-dependent hydrolase
VDTNPGIAEQQIVVPPGATDCHVHIFDPERFPYAPDRRYTPPPATVAALRSMHEALGMQRVVLVQPSVYGTDNGCLLDALRQLGARARGVAVIEARTSRDQLEDLHASGVRGVRVNLQVAKSADVSSALRTLHDLIETIQDVPMLVQAYAAMPLLLACSALLSAAPKQVLIDHFGLPRAAAGPMQDGFGELLALLASPNIWMKLSGPYQISVLAPAYPDVAEIASSLIKASPDRVVWGSDWPHSGGSNRAAKHNPAEVEPFRREDDQSNLRLVIGPETSGMRRQLLVDNPARLFDFGITEQAGCTATH